VVRREMGWKAAGGRGAVAAGGAEAVAAGMQILEDGGNAADAAVAAVLALGVTDFGSFALGGEVPFMIYLARERRVRVLSGIGRAPLDPEVIRWYLENGIPDTGDIRAAPVPAAVDACLTALRLYGTISFERAVEPTLRLLEPAAEPWQGRLAVTVHRLVEAERQAGGREEGLRAAADRFYRGDVADELEAWYIEKGGFLRKRDLAAHVTRVEEPVSARYRGYTVCKCGPWTQGPYLCQTLRLLEGFDLRAMGHLSADAIHVAVEALKLGLADRDEYYGDPLFAEVPLEVLLSDRYTEIRRPLIDVETASREVRPGDPFRMRPLKEPTAYPTWPGGTTTCVVGDRWGNLVAATPSCNFMFGEWEPGSTGIVHGNRLRSLNTCPGHPNCIQPGKRPRITLTPTLVLKDGEPVLAISVAGGDRQDQATLNLLLDFIEYDLPPERSVTAPRFATAHHQDSFNPHPDRHKAFLRVGEVTLNSGIAEPVRKELERRGHRVVVTDEPIASPVMLYREAGTGTLHAAGDPAAGRHAAAL